MSEDANISDNNPASEVLGAAVRRRPGRPKGLPKPEGSGRKPGTPNRVGKEARELAGRYTTKAFKRLAEMLDSKDDKAAAIACREILDRAFGKPVSPQEITGANGTPLVPVAELTNHQRAKKLLFLIAKARAEAGEPGHYALNVLEDAAGIARPAKARTIDVTPPDPFAAQRAEQAAEIAPASAQTEGDTKLSDYASAAAAQRAERDAARAEGRLERPVPTWTEPGGTDAEHGLDANWSGQQTPWRRPGYQAPKFAVVSRRPTTAPR